MNFTEKKRELESTIAECLLPVVGKKCILIGLPYYENIGDVLIWEGTRQFMSSHGIQCCMLSSKETFRFPSLSQDVTILLQGGGNFGDLWLSEQIFRNEVINHYPNNKIIVLPQTVHYQDNDNMHRDARIYAQHQRLFVCARDGVSKSLLAECFSNNEIFLLPDMAFCISEKTINAYRKKENGKALFLLREDKELLEFDYMKYLTTRLAIDVKDWPTMIADKQDAVCLNLSRLLKYRRWLGVIPDLYGNSVFRPYMIRTGIRFVSQYNEIYTTRLHVAILSVLLGKKFTFYNNSYGKNKNFYDTWLSDLDEVRFVL